MGQFTLHENSNRNTREAFPYLLDVQAPLLADLNTRVVVPVANRTSLTGKPISHLCPVIEYDGQAWVLYTQQLAGVPLTALGKEVADMSGYRNEIINAIDFLVTGV